MECTGTYLLFTFFLQYSTDRQNLFLYENALKQGHGLLLMVLNFSSAYPIRKSQENQDRMILKGTHWLLLYADDVNLLHKYIYTINQNTLALLVATYKVGL
jgi:hypothetical protein